tara:strand:+ start:1666 stop:1977 length:312 start_codon:yes stop_codon:yes gene_type:complete
MRRDGKTTRLIDAAIQELFTKGDVYIPNGAKAVRLHGKDGGRGIDELVYQRMTKYTDYDFWDEYGKMHPAVQDNFASRFRQRLYSEHEFDKIGTDGFIYKIEK